MRPLFTEQDVRCERQLRKRAGRLQRPSVRRLRKFTLLQEEAKALKAAETFDGQLAVLNRIAEEISYIDVPEGDIPNLQIDGWRSQTTKGIPVTDSMELTFHTQSLPTARLVWHCPFITLFTSEDGSADGAGFREFLLLRLDGENWESDKHAENDVHIDHTRDFPGWNVWKETNKNGMDCTVKIRRDGSRVTMETCNLGIAIYTATTILDHVSEIYVALTGDQCALTNIRIEHF